MTSTELILTGWEVWTLEAGNIREYFLNLNDAAWDEWRSVSTDNVGTYG